MLAETRVTGTVDERIGWLDESVATVERLRADGVPVVGYAWWPLFDMCEWTWRHTGLPRSSHLLTMGLFDLVESSEDTAARPQPGRRPLRPPRSTARCRPLRSQLSHVQSHVLQPAPIEAAPSCIRHA